ncbi:Chemotaxis response regulator protein-glutamate methylesterase [Crateriforma conspicua]|uniref:Protein-glutamate methylesterase/protein-glutamine glutaminase n=2 Tax=Planctomycetaceae TaxID=126 RepID=A0A5C6FSX7_9PLAN|nr:Chemotaxis response regulator protein-glutamate methylesterase [Crateriforma conspicua]
MKDQSMPISALVVDDSLLFRKVVRDCLAQIGDVEVIGVAGDGKAAVEKIRRFRPDVVTLDVEMPGMDGLAVLRQIKRDRLPTKIIMLSALTERGADATTEALSLGAFDFILKPSHGSPEKNLAELKDQLSQRISAVRRRPTSASKTAKPSITRSPRSTMATKRAVAAPSRRAAGLIEAVLIGISTGGPKALRALLTQLPADYSVPIIIVQHMPPMFTASMARDIDRHAKLDVVEAADEMPLIGGTAYIAPGGKHLEVHRVAGSLRACVTDAPPERNCKPSVNVMFRTASDATGGRVLGAIMTGMGDDGLAGCQHLRNAGGTVWAQDEASCTVFGMPRQIIEAGLADRILPLNQFADALIQTGQKRLAVCH